MMMTMRGIMDYYRAEAHGKLVREWQGVLIADETTRTEGRPRWAEFRVYRLEGPDHFLVHTTGSSVVYHRAKTTCRTSFGKQPGEPCTVDDLPDDAEPCGLCRPQYPEDLGDREEIRFEFTRHKFTEGTAAEVVAGLTTYRERKTGNIVTRVPAPVAALLSQLRDSQPEFSAVPWPEARVVPAALTQGDDDDEPDDTGHQPRRSQGQAGRVPGAAG